MCEKMGIGHLKDMGDIIVGSGGNKLSSSERSLITLTRALLSSVDILLLSNTLDNFTTDTRTKVLEVIHEMIQNRGLAYDIGPGSSLSLR